MTGIRGDNMKWRSPWVKQCLGEPFVHMEEDAVSGGGGGNLGGNYVYKYVYL